MSIGRDLALYQVDQADLPGWRRGSLGRSRANLASDGREWATAERISVQVFKQLKVLQQAIWHFSGRRPGSLEEGVQKILVVALAQLQQPEAFPASAAVDEGVEQCRRWGLKRACGVVNAVLRKASSGSWPKLPGRSDDVMAYCTLTLSHPRWFAERLIEALGTRAAIDLMEHNNREAPMVARLGPGATLESVTSRGLKAIAHERAGFVVLEGARRADIASLARDGVAQVQDPTAAGTVAAAGLKPGMRVLDRCCGRGTKTLQMLELVGPGGEVWAMDPAQERCESLRESLVARKAENVHLAQASWLAETDFPAQVDAAIVDAPCGASGALARRPEARWRQDAKRLGELTALQAKIVADTLDRVRPGGVAVYATCSVLPIEDEAVVQKVMTGRSDWRVESSQRVLPASGEAAMYHDGGFLAVMRRVG